jgi:hypothetical protein
MEPLDMQKLLKHRITSAIEIVTSDILIFVALQKMRMCNFADANLQACGVISLSVSFT